MKELDRTGSILHILFVATLLLLVPTISVAQTFRSQVENYLDNYKRYDAEIARATLKECTVDDDNKSVKIVIGGGFQEQHFTEENVDSIYRRIKSFLPSGKRNYDISVITENHDIKELIPNFFRKGNLDKTRLWKQIYTGNPWVKNVSRPYLATDGLEGVHVSLWQSHGRVYRESKHDWVWQRPRLFCTNEDLFSQTFVIPYIIPMLQNAGAVVFTPRERDWQSNEVIVDNDRPTFNGSYIESARRRKTNELWHTTDKYGFSNIKDVYIPVDTPFTYGTARWTEAVQMADKEKYACWIPDLPEDGRYAVYVSYQSYENSVNDAHYKVYHKGGMTEFVVNQRIGGSTWVYLGTFEFDKGLHDSNMVVLSNRCDSKGIITADAVRFGGGMGNMARGLSMNGGTVSGMPRWAEAARYSAQWYGIPPSIHTQPFGSDDYKNDISSRSKILNLLSGRSVYNPDTVGYGVPFEVHVAFHTDAGIKKNGKIGSLSIYRTEYNEGKTSAGLDRYVSRDLASMLLTNLSKDLSKYNWNVRQLWNRDYGEAREPSIPACILEMLSHQNFEDMKLGYDPNFKFDFCRSVYKTIVKFVATEHGRNYVIQPLPVEDFYIDLNKNKSTAELHWRAVEDKSEPTAKPDEFIVYTRKGFGDFDNGTLVKRNSFTVKLEPEEIYSFKVTAVNKGGESFPSEILAAGISSKDKGSVLIVNAFTRLEGPKIIDTATEQGFDLDADPGVQYGKFAGFCGAQKVFDKSKMGDESSSGLGFSGSELEGKVIMGNTFDYPFLHAQGIMATKAHSFTSASVSAIKKGYVKMKDYKMVDMIYGVQKEFDKEVCALIDNYNQSGGRTFVSGANLMNNSMLSDKSFSCKTLHCNGSSIISDKNVKGVEGSNMKFSLLRDMNETCYSTPTLTSLIPDNNAFAMLSYSDGSAAGIAYNGIESKTIVLGFPVECVKESINRNTLVKIITEFLCK